MLDLAHPIKVLRDQAASGPLNMAIDEALLRTSEKPILRVYWWSEPWISIGYFEKVPPSADSQVGLIRRWTGGGQVVHGAPGTLTYSIALPRSEPFSRQRSPLIYRAIHQEVARALSAAGIPTSLFHRSQATPGGPCFQRPTENDVAHAETGEKLAGAGQRRSRAGLLHQGEIQGAPEDLMPHLIEALCGPDAEPYEPRQAMRSLADELCRNRYATEAWLHRR